MKRARYDIDTTAKLWTIGEFIKGLEAADAAGLDPRSYAFDAYAVSVTNHLAYSRQVFEHAKQTRSFRRRR